MIMIPENTTSQSRVETVRNFLQELLITKQADAVLTLARNPWAELPMPTLVTDPDKLDTATPLAPVAPVSTARQAVSLTRSETGQTIAMVMRPCEIRALIELAKLNQTSLKNTLIISMECTGRMENRDFIKRQAQQPDFETLFFDDPELQKNVCTTCHTCDAFLPDNTDITICTMGLPQEQTGFEAVGEKGTAVLEALSFKAFEPDAQRQTLIEKRLKQKAENKKNLFEKTAAEISSIKGFEQYIARCLNCYNCRSACPVCYCKECVFLTDVFAHPPELLLERAKRRGRVKMPVDTSMFHMTRLSHIGHACIGCGQCSSVCPSDIPVADMFRTIGAKTQAFYEYQPGKSLDDPIPQLAAAKMPTG